MQNEMQMQVDSLRRDFDLAFASAPSAEHRQIEGLLAIRVAGDAYALRLSEIVGLAADCAVQALPTPIVALMGLASLRAQIVPVYDLGVLLGYPAAVAARWLVLVRGEALVALAFEQFEAHLRTELMSLEGAGSTPSRSHLAGAVQSDSMRPIVDLNSIFTHITQIQSTVISSPDLGSVAS